MSIKKIVSVVLVAAMCLSQCPGNDKGCASCDGSQCKACFWSALDEEGRCLVPLQQTANCLMYAEEAKCDVCEAGYYVNGKGECDKIEIGLCAQQKDSATCLICSNGIQVVDGICDPANSCGMDKCSACDLEGYCYECESGYYLDLDDGCQQDNDSIKNCIYAENQKCGLCKVGFFDMNGQCQPSNRGEIEKEAAEEPEDESNNSPKPADNEQPILNDSESSQPIGGESSSEPIVTSVRAKDVKHKFLGSQIKRNDAKSTLKIKIKLFKACPDGSHKNPCPDPTLKDMQDSKATPSTNTAGNNQALLDSCPDGSLKPCKAAFIFSAVFVLKIFMLIGIN